MATMYPEDDRYITDDRIDELKNRIKVLEDSNKELNIVLMRKSAEASEAQETLKRWRTEIEVLRDQRGHNLCHMGIPRLLKVTLGDSAPYPDPENITAEQFAAGCIEYHKSLFGDCGIELAFMRYRPGK